MPISARIASFSAIAAALFLFAVPEISHTPNNPTITAAPSLRQAAPAPATSSSATPAPLDGLGWD